ncbi:DUF397 domain-containing protein [Streptomyces reniochalinae]|uniref:DUF397 domain-containing protein n=1 Tax=Streptomyces reniochalinae TaxID=2250578 RepID=A0A367E5Y7_9ACTN|nr:DUF397 domain-containing protein [Streptomyces reniochalinae]RCG13476.1 DUF397 domain-containing protein [Streptomyces reniochalinae]
MATEQQTTADLSLAWFKSSYSGGGGGNCVEVAHAATGVRIRDSKAVDGPQLAVSSLGWAGFIEQLVKDFR